MTQQDRYTRVAIALHWAIAAFIVFNLLTGFFMEGWRQPLRSFALMLHASSGLTVLVLTVVRVAWRLLHVPPPLPAGMKPWERHAAHIAHFVLYAAMVIMPLTGWAILSAHAPPGSRGAQVEFSAPPGVVPGGVPGSPTAGRPALPPGMPPGGPPPLKIWNLFQMPKISAIEAIGKEPGGIPPLRALHDEFVGWHGVGGWLLVFLLILHVAGALKHEFVDKQFELARMGIRRRGPA